MSWRRTIVVCLLGVGSLLAGCQWLLPERTVPGTEPRPTVEGPSSAFPAPLPTLPLGQPSEAPRLSPSIEIPPPVD